MSESVVVVILASKEQSPLEIVNEVARMIKRNGMIGMLNCQAVRFGARTATDEDYMGWFREALEKLES